MIRSTNVSALSFCHVDAKLTFIATHPVIFTKRSTSIIACGNEIYPHTEFTGTLDYEGEIGVIIGKPGFRIDERNAMDYVWGYTIINGEHSQPKNWQIS